MTEHITNERARADDYWERRHVEAVMAINVARRGLLKAGRKKLPDVDLVQPTEADNVYQLVLKTEEGDTAA